MGDPTSTNSVIRERENYFFFLVEWIASLLAFFNVFRGDGPTGIGLNPSLLIASWKIFPRLVIGTSFSTV